MNVIGATYKRKRTPYGSIRVYNFDGLYGVLTSDAFELAQVYADKHN